MFTIDSSSLGADLKIGDKIICPHCGRQHIVFGSADENGSMTNTILIYQCGHDSYLAGVRGQVSDGRIIVVEHDGGL